MGKSLYEKVFDRHVVATPLSEDAGTPTVDASVWWCENDPVPEASAGPHDSQYLFGEFRTMMG